MPLPKEAPCGRCRWYMRVGPLAGSFPEHPLRHACLQRAFLPLGQDIAARVPPSEWKDGLVVYCDAHVARYWSGRRFCAQHWEHLLARLVPLVLSALALLVSLWALYYKRAEVQRAEAPTAQRSGVPSAPSTRQVRAGTAEDGVPARPAETPAALDPGKGGGR